MSEAAILRRLKTVDQLRALCLSLMKAKKESDAKKKNDFDRRENRRNKFLENYEQTNYDSVSGNDLGRETI